MNNTNIIAAIVLGSSKITGIVGTKEIDGSIRVKGHVALPSSDFIGKGRVLNIEKMTTCLTNIKAHLEEEASCRFKCFYVAVDCQGLRSMSNEVSIQLPQSEIVSDDMLASISVRNKEANPADREILEAIALEYIVGTKSTLEPKGMPSDRLVARFLNVTCNTTVISTIRTCFRKAGIEIAGGRICIAAQQLATIVTSEQERTSGCAFVDMGSETTTVAIYKNKLLRHLVTIPLGGANITRDIMNVFNVEQDEAENFKCTYGYPDIEEIDEKEEIHLRDGGRVKKLADLADIIDARVEEIVQNIKHQVEISGYTSDTLVNGLYVCGGGAQMKNIQSAFATHFKDWNVRIIKNVTRPVVVSNDKKFNDSGIFNIGLAIIDNADVNCYGGDYQGLFGNEPTPEEVEVKRLEEEAAAKKAEEERLAEEARLAEEERIAEEAAKPKGSSRMKTFLGKLKDFATGMVSED